MTLCRSTELVGSITAPDIPFLTAFQIVCKQALSLSATAAVKHGSRLPRDTSEHKKSRFVRYSSIGSGMFSFSLPVELTLP